MVLYISRSVASDVNRDQTGRRDEDEVYARSPLRCCGQAAGNSTCLLYLKLLVLSPQSVSIHATDVSRRQSTPDHSVFTSLH